MTQFLQLRSANSGAPFVGENQNDTVLWDATERAWFVGPGGGGGAVSSVFGRIGAVVAATGDYDGDQVDNVSTVPGASLSDALDYLLANAGAVASVFGRVGIVVAATGDYDGDQVDNVSTVPGASISDALEALAASIPAFGAISNGQVVVKTAGSLVGLSGASVEDVLSWNGAAWVSTTLTPAFTPPANPADNGKVAVASAGDFIYVGALTAGFVLTWNGSAWTGAAAASVPNVSNTQPGLAPQITGTTGLALISNGTSAAWSTNFQAQNLQTTGGILLGGAVTPTAVATAGWLSVSGQGNSGILYRSIGGVSLIAMTFGNGATDDRLTLGTTPNANISLNLSTGGRLNFSTNQILTWTATAVNLVPSGVLLNFSTSGQIQRGSSTIFSFANSNTTVDLFGTGTNFAGGDRLVSWNAVATVPGAGPAVNTALFVYNATASGGSALTAWGSSGNITGISYAGAGTPTGKRLNARFANGAVQTVGATQAVVGTFAPGTYNPVVNNCQVAVRGVLNGKNAANEGITVEASAVFSVVASVVTLQGASVATSPVGAATLATVTASFDALANIIRFIATGAAGQTIDWTCYLTVTTTEF